MNVQTLAPQLVSFAGSQANFQSLVNGLANGTQVQLFTVLASGFVQSVSFTPTAALTPLQVAQVLETARQQLIGLGIAAPTAEQLAFALMGGVVPTALGGTPVAGVLNPQTTAQTPQTLPSPAAQIQSQASAGATAPTTPGITNSVNVQTTPGITDTAIGGTATLPRPNTSDSPIPAGATSRSVSPFASTSPTVNTSASPFAGAPLQAPGAGSTPRAVERVPAGARPARN